MATKKQRTAVGGFNALLENVDERLKHITEEEAHIAGLDEQPAAAVPAQGGVGEETTRPQEPASKPSETPVMQTKKATTIMPKEVFNALQHYCTDTDTPKHRVLYLFLVDGLHNAGAISDEEHHRFRDLAKLLTTTYQK